MDDIPAAEGGNEMFQPVRGAQREWLHSSLKLTLSARSARLVSMEVLCPGFC